MCRKLKINLKSIKCLVIYQHKLLFCATIRKNELKMKIRNGQISKYTSEIDKHWWIKLLDDNLRYRYNRNKNLFIKNF